MKYAKTCLMIAPFLALSLASLSGCVKDKVQTNSGVSVERPYIPEPETAKDSDVAVLLEEYDSALMQCNANF